MVFWVGFIVFFALLFDLKIWSYSLHIKDWRFRFCGKKFARFILGHSSHMSLGCLPTHCSLYVPVSLPLFFLRLGLSQGCSSAAILGLNATENWRSEWRSTPFKFSWEAESRNSLVLIRNILNLPLSLLELLTVSEKQLSPYISVIL